VANHFVLFDYARDMDREPAINELLLPKK